MQSEDIIKEIQELQRSLVAGRASRDYQSLGDLIYGITGLNTLSITQTLDALQAVLQKIENRELTGDASVVNFQGNTALTADGDVYVKQSGENIYLKRATFAFSASVAGWFYLRDGVGGTILHTAEFGATGSVQSIITTDVMKFTTKIYFDLQAGTLTRGNFSYGGYEL